MPTEIYTKDEIDALLPAPVAAPPLDGGCSTAPPAQFFMTRHNQATDLFRSWGELSGFRRDFQLDAPAVALLSLNIDLIHRNICVGPVGYGIRIRHRTAATQSALSSAAYSWVPHAYAAGNIADIDDHYGRATIPNLPFALPPGWHQFSVWGNSHSSAAPNTDGLIELNNHNTSDDYNYFSVVLLPGASFVSV